MQTLFWGLIASLFSGDRWTKGNIMSDVFPSSRKIHNHISLTYITVLEENPVEAFLFTFFAKIQDIEVLTL